MAGLGAVVERDPQIDVDGIGVQYRVVGLPPTLCLRHLSEEITPLLIPLNESQEKSEEGTPGSKGKGLSCKGEGGKFVISQCFPPCTAVLNQRGTLQVFCANVGWGRQLAIQLGNLAQRALGLKGLRIEKAQVTNTFVNLRSPYGEIDLSIISEKTPRCRMLWGQHFAEYALTGGGVAQIYASGKVQISSPMDAMQMLKAREELMGVLKKHRADQYQERRERAASLMKSPLLRPCDSLPPPPPPRPAAPAKGEELGVGPCGTMHTGPKLPGTLDQKPLPASDGKGGKGVARTKAKPSPKATKKPTPKRLHPSQKIALRQGLSPKMATSKGKAAARLIVNLDAL